MPHHDSPDARVHAWLEALDARHLADLTPSEVARALRALSSCYVERRSKLAQGGALDSAGKRAAFALFYAPVHFFLTREIVRRLMPAGAHPAHIYDLGCGTGAAGAAWALEADRARMTGADRHPWAVAEANWTYRQLGLDGHAIQRDVARLRIDVRQSTGILAAYAINELPEATRSEMLARLTAAAGTATVLIIEPIARRTTPWWGTWEAAFAAAGGRADEWRFPTVLPERQRQLARAAGLNPTELTARSLFIA